MGERRGFTRYGVDAGCNLKTEEGAAYNFETGPANISFEGAAVHLRQKIDCIENKDVQFELATRFSEKPLTGKARIRYIINSQGKDSAVCFKMGLEFIEIDKSTLRQLLNKLQEISCSRLKKPLLKVKNQSGYSGLF